MRMRRLLRTLGLCVALLCAGSGAWGTTYVWTTVAGDTSSSLWPYTGSETDYAAIAAAVTAGTDYDTSGTISITNGTVASTDVIIIASGSSSVGFINGWTNNGTIVNYGTVTMTSGFTNTGTIIVAENGSMTVKEGSGLVNTGTITIASGGTLSLPNGGSNSGTGTITNSGTMTVTGSFSNSGTVKNVGSATFNNGLTNSGTVIGTITGTVSGGTYISSSTAVHGSGNTYNWAGTVNSEWTEPLNWKDGSGNYFFDSYPGSASGQTAVIPVNNSVEGLALGGSGYTLTIQCPATGAGSTRATRAHIKGCGANAASADITSDGTFLIESCNFKSLTVTNGTIRLYKPSGVTAPALQVQTLNVESGGTVYGQLGTNLYVSGTAVNKGRMDVCTLTVDGATTNKGTIICGTGGAQFYADFTAAAGSSFTASSGDTVFVGNADFSAMSAGNFVANGGTVYFFGTGTLKTCSGQTFNTLRFGGSVTINTSTGAVTVGTLSMETDTSVVPYLTESFTATITGTGAVTAANVYLSRVSDTNGVYGMLKLAGNVTVSGSFTMAAGSALSISSGATLTLAGFTNASPGDYSYAIQVAGTLKTSADSGSMTMHAMNLIVQTGGIINVSGIDVSFEDDPSTVTYNTAAIALGVTDKSCVVSNAGTITAKSVTVPADTTVANTKIMTLSGALTGGKTLTNGSSGSITAASVTFSDSITNANQGVYKGSITSNSSASAAATVSAAAIENNGSISFLGGNSTLSFGSYSGSGSVITYGGTIESTSATSATIDTLSIVGATVCTGLTDGLIIDRSLLVYYGLLVQTGGLTVNGTGGSFSYINNDITTGGAQQYNGTVKVNDNAVLVSDGNIAFSTIEISSGKSLAFGSASTDAYAVTVNDDWTNNGTLTANQSTVTFKGTGKTVSGSSVFYNAVFEGSTTLAGVNTYTDFTCSTGGITLTVSDNQAVSGKLTLQGADGSLLALAGTGKFTAGTAAANFAGQYLSIGSDIEIWKTGEPAVTAGAFTVTGSSGTDTAATYAVLYGHGWKLSDVTYTWTGSTSTAWNDAANWSVGLVPGDAANNTDGVTVIIPDGVANKPVASAAYRVKSLTIGTAAAAAHDASLTLSSTDHISVGTDDTSGAVLLTNYGTLVYASAGRIMCGPAAVNDITHSGTVEYSGTGQTVTDFGSTDYANLVISGSATAGSAVTISGALRLSGTGTINFSSTTNTGTFSCTMTGGTVSLNSFTVASGGLSVPSPVAVQLSGTITTTGGGTQSYGGAVTLASDVAIDASPAGIVTFGSTVDDTAAGVHSLTLTTGGTVTFAGPLGGTARISSLTACAGITEFAAAAVDFSQFGFTHSSGTVRFTGAGANITGAGSGTTFYNAEFCGSGAVVNGTNTYAGTADFKADTTIMDANTFASFACTAPGVTLTFEGDKTQTVTGSFTIRGSDASHVTLISTQTPASAADNGTWLLDTTGATVSVRYATVSYAKAVVSIARFVSDSQEGVSNSTINWFDVSGPGFSLSAVAVGSDKLYVLFDKVIKTSENYAGAISIITNGGADAALSITSAVPVNYAKRTGAVFTLSRKVTLDDITSLYLAVKDQNSALKDENGFSARQYAVHPLSDFAVDVINPRYAYGYNSESGAAAGGALGSMYGGADSDSSYTVHDWDRNQQGYGTLVWQDTERIFMNASAADGVGTGITIYLDNSPAGSAVSAKYNAATGASWRIWLPDAFSAIAGAGNSCVTETGVCTAGKGGMRSFLLDVTKSGYRGWKSGDQVTFLFSLDGCTVYHNPQWDGTTFTPGDPSSLYCLRLSDKSDPASLDLWSFKLKSISQQRGGVTILNNVINASAGEKTVVQVNMPLSGTLNVMVMTLDGNIVTYLQHGTASAGTHYYQWNGRNNAGNPVARGLYFVRVVGSGIDETRKVMVVKD